MFYAVRGGDFYAVRTTEGNVEFAASSYLSAVSTARIYNSLQRPGLDGFVDIPDLHRFYIHGEERAVRDSTDPTSYAVFSGTSMDGILRVCMKLNRNHETRCDYTWTECDPIGANETLIDGERVQQVRMSYLRDGFIWSNHGLVWFWSEEMPQWNGYVFSAKSKHQFNLPWVKFSRNWSNARNSLSKVVK